jgi:hypothetical protein
MDFNKEPISLIEWIDSRNLSANDYNPNVVLSQELKLLEFSLLKQGWIQPILITSDNVIIDCFHRYWLSSNSKPIIEKYKYMVPVVRLELSEPERMLLTIRINRAKGNHIAFKMHEIVYKLLKEYQVDAKTIAEEIGASKKEIELLSKKDVFEVLDIEHYDYSKAWEPKRKFDNAN